jgi:hypothetical protein
VQASTGMPLPGTSYTNAKGDKISVDTTQADAPDKFRQEKIAYDAFGEHFDAPELTASEYNAVSRYTGEGYYDINMFLRNDRNIEMTAQADTYHGLNSALEKYETPEDTIAFRGLSETKAFGPDVEPQSLVGTTFTDKAFVSLTQSAEVASRFGLGSGMGARAVLRVHVPKGTHAVHVGRAMAHPQTGLKNSYLYGAEAELFVGPNTAFKITKVTPGGFEATDIEYSNDGCALPPVAQHGRLEAVLPVRWRFGEIQKQAAIYRDETTPRLSERAIPSHIACSSSRVRA